MADNWLQLPSSDANGVLHAGWSLGTVEVVHAGTGMMSIFYCYDWLTKVNSGCGARLGCRCTHFLLLTAAGCMVWLFREPSQKAQEDNLIVIHSTCIPRMLGLSHLNMVSNGTLLSRNNLFSEVLSRLRAQMPMAGTPSGRMPDT